MIRMEVIYIPGKIYPNEDCPCGSGKKYKYCCKGKENGKFHNEMEFYTKWFKQIKEEKFCIYNTEGNCHELIINAHSVQNHKILDKLQVENHVYSMAHDMKSFGGANLKLVGRNEVTTAKCFCKKHDTELFKNIEIEAFEGRKDQLFMFAYRAFAKSYYDRLQSMRGMEKLFTMKPQFFDEYMVVMNQVRGSKLTIIDNERLRKLFNDCIKEENYDLLSNYIIELDYEIGFATSFMIPLSYDLNEKMINDMDDIINPYMKNLFLSVFPDEDRSYILLSWLKEDDEFYLQFAYDLKEIYLKDKEQFYTIMNNLLTQEVDNYAISPLLIEKWTEEQKIEFIEAQTKFMFLEGRKISKNLKKRYFKFDLFQKV